MSITIRLENTIKPAGFICRGREKNLCHGCTLRFQCLTDRNEIVIPQTVIAAKKINSLESLVKYMFSDGQVELYEDVQTTIVQDGKKQSTFVMRVKE